MTGSGLRVTLRSLEGSEDVRYEGSLIKSIVDMIPCEKTKEPTLMPICRQSASMGNSQPNGETY